MSEHAREETSETRAADEIARDWNDHDKVYDDGFAGLNGNAAAEPEARVTAADDQVWSQVRDSAERLEHMVSERHAADQVRSVAGQNAQALALAKQALEAGVEPALIMDELKTNAPHAAAEFVKEWNAHDNGFESAADMAEFQAEVERWDMTAVDYAEREMARRRMEAAAAQDAADRKAAQEAHEHHIAFQQTIKSELDRARATLPGFRDLEPLMNQIQQQLNVQMDSPESARDGIEVIYQAAVEAQRARHAAGLKADATLAAHSGSSLDPFERGWMKSRDEAMAKPPTREQLVEHYLAEHAVDPRRLQPRAVTRAEHVAQVRASLEPDEMQRAIDAGFASIDSFDVQAAMAAERARTVGRRK